MDDLVRTVAAGHRHARRDRCDQGVRHAARVRRQCQSPGDDLSLAEHLVVSRRLCTLSAECGPYAWLLLADDRTDEAVAAFEDWMTRSRDPIGPANDLKWLARHYVRTGRTEDAMRVASFAGDTGSARGMVVLAETLTSLGRTDEALEIYEAIAGRYRERVPLGTHRLRMALRDASQPDRLSAMADLQDVFPTGLEPLTLTALGAMPTDGVRFGPLGRRALRIGARPGDIVVGVDEWRVRTWQQYDVLMDLRPQQEAVTLTVYRNGRYQQLALRVPERRMAVGLHNVVQPR
jgi:hypothetical protein